MKILDFLNEAMAKGRCFEKMNELLSWQQNFINNGGRIFVSEWLDDEPVFFWYEEEVFLDLIGILPRGYKIQKEEPSDQEGWIFLVTPEESIFIKDDG